MSDAIEEKLEKIPIIAQLADFSKKVILPGFEGLSLYDLLETYALGIVKGTFSTRASSIAFSFFMAIFPALLFLLNLVPYIPISNFQAQFLDFIEELLPPQTSSFFEPILVDIAANPRGGLLSLVGVLAIILTANGVNAIFSGFEYSYHVEINRSVIRQYLVSIGVGIILVLLFLLTASVIIYIQYLMVSMEEQGYRTGQLVWLPVLRYVFFLVMTYCIIATLYYFGTKESRQSRFFSLGALMTTLLFILTTYLFGVYINNFSTYNELYGSIGALLILMIYIWINANLLLLGFELNATLRKLKSGLRSKSDIVNENTP
ncbi:YihY/virulence factor BrkB family protein [Croceiramulus getboli]|nr:YihY/virulence factor BrkB family protein [Flavobacteriaceae bacterium YJPT1-3]